MAGADRRQGGIQSDAFGNGNDRSGVVTETSRKQFFSSWWFFAALIGAYFGLAIYTSTLYAVLYEPQHRSALLYETDSTRLYLAVEELCFLGLALLALFAAGWRARDLPFRLDRVAIALTVGLFAFFTVEGIVYEHILREWFSFNTGFDPIQWGRDFTWRNYFGVMEGGQLSLPVIIFASLVIGLYEEVIVLGFVIAFVEKRGGKDWFKTAILLSTLIRVSYHTYQGQEWLFSHILMGLVFAACYVRWRNLLPFVLVHALIDIFVFLSVWKGW